MRVFLTAVAFCAFSFFLGLAGDLSAPAPAAPVASARVAIPPEPAAIVVAALRTPAAAAAPAPRPHRVEITIEKRASKAALAMRKGVKAQAAKLEAARGWKSAAKGAAADSAA